MKRRQLLKATAAAPLALALPAMASPTRHIAHTQIADYARYALSNCASIIMTMTTVSADELAVYQPLTVYHPRNDHRLVTAGEDVVDSHLRSRSRFATNYWGVIPDDLELGRDIRIDDAWITFKHADHPDRLWLLSISKHDEECLPYPHPIPDGTLALKIRIRTSRVSSEDLRRKGVGTAHPQAVTVAGRRGALLAGGIQSA